MGIWQVTELTCPICGNSWKFTHTYKTQPEIGACERCATHFNTGTQPREQIEHKRPKTLFWVRPVDR